MWTPKRIMMLAIGFVVFTAIYLVYSMTSLGRINTLPPLPDKYTEGNQNHEGEPVPDLRPRGPTPLERKLEMAFRPGCPELKWLVRLELNSRSMVMAAGDFKVEKDGRLLLEPMSVALFGKKKNDGKGVEINTLRCKRAYITFDRPVSSLSPSELNGRKVVAAELFGEGDTPIKIENNRRTAESYDDLTVIINTGPLHYNEKKQIIWTNDMVHVRDGWLEPPRADVRAKGMHMELATSAPPPKPGAPIAAKPKTEAISGVKRIVLNQDVTMDLHLAGGAPLPGGDKGQPTAENRKTAAGGAPAKSNEPSHVIIRTPGRFQYDLFKDHDLAQFDVPAEELSRSPQDVTVQRVSKEGAGSDQLVCKHLELRVKRRSNDASPPGKTGPAAQSSEQGLEIETAHATGPNVILTSDAEKLDAHGTDFFYDATKKLTILKGAPKMEANKEDSRIMAPELRIQDIPLAVPPGSPPKTYQQVEASGPGEIYLTSKTSGQESMHASWNKRLISTREDDLDLLVLTGAGRFEDKEHGQSLQAEILKVYLLPEEAKPATKPKKTLAKNDKPSSPQQTRRPQRLEALRNVKAESRELTIPSAGRLIVHFEDVPAERLPPPSGGQNKAKPETRPQAPAAAATAAKAPAPAGKPGAISGPGPQAKAPPKEPEPDRPIELTARSIEADVLRCGERMALDHLHAEGGSQDTRGVEVIQKPAKTGEGGVFIHGSSLDMTCTPQGNILEVTGDLAQLVMGKMIIIGPQVNIDQATNKASVLGRGAMQIESDQTLEGKPLDHSTPLKINWGQEMFFSGASAEFQGDIQAEQANAHLACQHLHVFFDRPISLKQGVRGDQPVKVRNLVGDKEVRIEDKTVVRNRLDRHQRLEGIAVSMESEPREDVPPLSSPEAGRKEENKRSDANKVKLSGPGSVRLMQRGGSDLTAGPGQPMPNRPADPKKAAGDQQMKLTYIRFEQMMMASSLKNMASFWGSVRVLYYPFEDKYIQRELEREIDLESMIEDLPEGGMYLRCDRLHALTEKKLERIRQEGRPDRIQERTNQVMQADGQVIVRAKEFFAQADHMTFNEEKDQVIFTGDPDHPAILQKREIQGAPPQVFRAKKILYIRKTGVVKVDQFDSIDG